MILSGVVPSPHVLQRTSVDSRSQVTPLSTSYLANATFVLLTDRIVSAKAANTLLNTRICSHLLSRDPCPFTNKCPVATKKLWYQLVGTNVSKAVATSSTRHRRYTTSSGKILSSRSRSAGSAGICHRVVGTSVCGSMLWLRLRAQELERCPEACCRRNHRIKPRRERGASVLCVQTSNSVYVEVVSLYAPLPSI